jgi:hypothetical protein
MSVLSLPQHANGMRESVDPYCSRKLHRVGIKSIPVQSDEKAVRHAGRWLLESSLYHADSKGFRLNPIPQTRDSLQAARGKILDSIHMYAACHSRSYSFFSLESAI